MDLTIYEYTLCASKKTYVRTFLVVQWLRICSPRQGMWVWFTVGEWDPTYQGATREAWVLCLPSLCALETALKLEKAHMLPQRPSAAKQTNKQKTTTKRNKNTPCQVPAKIRHCVKGFMCILTLTATLWYDFSPHFTGTLRNKQFVQL